MKEYDEAIQVFVNLQSQERIRWVNQESKTVIFGGENPNTAEGMNRMRTVSLYVEGTRVDVIFRNPEYAEAVNNSQVTTLMKALPGVVKWVGTATRVMSGLNTTLNPDFVLANLVRDFGQAQIMSMLDAENGEPKELNKAYWRMMSGEEGALGAILRGVKFKAQPLTIQEMNGLNIFDANDRKTLNEMYGKKRVNDTMFDYFMEAGGVTGFAAVQQLEKLHKEIKVALMKENKSKGSKFIGAVRKPFSVGLDLIETSSEVLELVTRYAVFVANIQAGKSIADAATQSKNLTTNFNRRGKWGPAISSMYMFFNASTQGLRQQFMTMARNPKRTAGILVALTAMGYADYMLSYLLGGWDDDEVERPGAYVYETNLTIPLGGKTYLKIPLPQFWRMFWGNGVALARFQLGEIDGWQLAGELFGGMEENVVFNYQETGERGDLLRAMTPSILQPMYDLARNSDVFGRPIYKEDKFERGIPDSELGSKNVNEVFYGIAQLLNRMGGGSTKRPAGMRKDGSINPLLNLLDVNPSKWEYVLQQYAGGIGQFTTRAWRLGVAVISPEEELELRNTPFINRFFGTEFTPSPSSQYYEDKEEITKYKAVLNREIKAGDINPKSSAVIGFYKRAAHFDRINKIISTINNELKNVDETDARYKELMEGRARWQRYWNRIADVTDWEDKESVKKAEAMYKEYKAKDPASRILNNK